MGNSVGRPLRTDEDELQVGNFYTRPYVMESEGYQEALHPGNTFPRLSMSDEDTLQELPPEASRAFLFAQGEPLSPQPPTTLQPGAEVAAPAEVAQQEEPTFVAFQPVETMLQVNFP